MSEKFDPKRKGALLELFTDMVRANLDQDADRYDKAIEVAETKGITEGEKDWLFGLSPSEFWGIFGEDAINEDLQARMKEADDLAGAFGWGEKPFKGMYPKLEK